MKDRDPDGELSAERQDDRGDDLLPVQKCAVRGAEILHDDSGRRGSEPRVASGHEVVAGELDVETFHPSDLHGTPFEWNAPAGLGPLDDLEHVVGHAVQAYEAAFVGAPSALACAILSG